MASLTDTLTSEIGRMRLDERVPALLEDTATQLRGMLKERTRAAVGHPGDGAVPTALVVGLALGMIAGAAATLVALTLRGDLLSEREESLSRVENGVVEHPLEERA